MTASELPSHTLSTTVIEAILRQGWPGGDRTMFFSKHGASLAQAGISLGLILGTMACGLEAASSDEAMSPEPAAPADDAAARCAWTAQWSTTLTTSTVTREIVLPLREKGDTVSGRLSIGIGINIGLGAELVVSGNLDASRSNLRGTWRATGNPTALQALPCKAREGDISFALSSDCKTAAVTWWCGRAAGNPLGSATATRQ